MTRNSWRQNLHGRTSQKQTHCHDAFGTVQSNIQWIPTVNIWMVNPSVSSKLKVRYIGMKLSNFCSLVPFLHVVVWWKGLVKTLPFFFCEFLPEHRCDHSGSLQIGNPSSRESHEAFWTVNLNSSGNVSHVWVWDLLIDEDYHLFNNLLSENAQ